MENTDKTTDTLESVSALIKELALNFDRDELFQAIQFQK